MKMKALLQTIVILALFAFNAYALEITFGDTAKYWPGWGGGVCTWSQGVTDNERDTIGTPNITGGIASVNGNVLNTVAITYNNTANYGPITPGDLFIDMGSNGDWDYVIDTDTKYIYSFSAGAFLLGSNTGYRLSGDRDNYAPSGPNFVDVWQAPYNATWDIRDDHPVLYAGGKSGTYMNRNANITPSAADFDHTTGFHTFTYSGLDLGLTSDNFTLGWTIDCANDVLYEKVTAPVPEPATLLLLGTGLLGLAGFRRKIKK